VGDVPAAEVARALLSPDLMPGSSLRWHVMRSEPHVRCAGRFGPHARCAGCFGPHARCAGCFGPHARCAGCFGPHARCRRGQLARPPRTPFGAEGEADPPTAAARQFGICATPFDCNSA
jgi:hypothetical protein